MHKLKHVHDTFKVLQFFYPNHCNILLLIQHSKFYIHIYANASVKQWTDYQPQHLQNQMKHSKIMHN